MSTVGLMFFLASVATIVFTVLAYKYIVPEKKRANLNKLGQFLNDLFNFKFLITEKIVQFCYVLCTISCVCYGIGLLFSFYSYSGYYYSYSQWFGLYGIALIVLGPIAVRLAYEGIMMGLLLIKNVMEINKKLKYQTEPEDYQMPTFKEIIAKENFDFIKNRKAKTETKAEEVKPENE